MLFVLILLNLIFVTSTTGNWHQLDGIEYYIEYTAVSGVDKAKEGCKAMNAILAVVKSQRIQDVLVRNIDNSKLTGLPFSFYIGLSRSGQNTLQWSDGTTNNTSVFTYWDVLDDVYDSRKLCVTMGYYAVLYMLFKWKIVECWKSNRYICQRIIPTTTNDFRSTKILTISRPTTTEHSFTSEETPTTEYKDETTIKDNCATIGM
ncbi:C-type lectin domain family 18 member A-like [Ciona intestinalis]